MTYGEAAKHYGVPKTTLHDRLHLSSGKLGRKPELTEAEEEIIVERSELGKVTYFENLPYLLLKKQFDKKLGDYF